MQDNSRQKNLKIGPKCFATYIINACDHMPKDRSDEKATERH